MAIFGMFGKEERSSVQAGQYVYSSDDPQGLIELLGNGGKSFAGESVNRHVALGVPTVAAAVNALSDAVASLPLQVFRNTAEGRVKAPEDPLYYIVHDVVNADFLTSFQWRKWVVTELMLEGRALTFIERNKAGRVMGLWPLELASVTIEIRHGRRIYTRRRGDGGADVYEAKDILDFVWMPASDGISHVNPVHNSRNAIGLAIAAERYASMMFENGGVPPLALKGPAMSPAASGRASTDIVAAIRAARREKKPVMTIPEGFDLKEIGIDPQKQQMIELRKFQINELARVWNVPPVLLHDLTGGTFNNSEQQSLAFVKFCLAPRLALIEAEMNTKLFARKTPSFVEFNVDGLLRGDDTARANFYGAAFKNAWLTPNEIRAMENRPLSTQPEADLLHVQGATVPLGMQSTAQPTTQTTNTEEPGEPADDPNEE